MSACAAKGVPGGPARIHGSDPPAGGPLPFLPPPGVFLYASAFFAFSTSSTRMTRMPESSPLALP